MDSSFIERSKRYSESDLFKKLDMMENELGISTKNPVPDMLSWEQLQEMHTSGLVEVGSHTCRHIRLTETIDSVLMEQEIVDSKRRLEKRFGEKVDTFCYPNGDYTPAAVEMVSKTYSAACTTQMGWNKDDLNPWLLKRIAVHDDISSTRAAFLARLSGYL